MGDFHLLQLEFSVLVSALILQHHGLDDRKDIAQLFTKLLLCGILSNSKQKASSSTQEAQLSPSDRAMRLVSSNLVNYHATVQKLLIRQVLTKPTV